MRERERERERETERQRGGGREGGRGGGEGEGGREVREGEDTVIDTCELRAQAAQRRRIREHTHT